MPRRLIALFIALATGFAGLVAVSASPAAAATLTTSWTGSEGSRSIHASPTLADLDGDGFNEVVIAGHDGVVAAYKANGQIMWTAAVDPVAGSRSAVDSSPTVADIENDGRMEVIVTAGSLFEVNHHGGVVVYDAATGQVKWRKPTSDKFNQWTGGRPDGYADGVFGSAAVGDVDGDGVNDVVFAAWDHKVYALNYWGGDVPGFPWVGDDTIWSSPALWDGDGDGRVEIYVGGDSTAGGPIDHSGGVVRMIDWRGDHVVEAWRQLVGENVMSSPAIGDINGDGLHELVVGTGLGYNNDSDREVFAFHLHDGSPVPGWPVTTGGKHEGNTFGSPALGDLTGDRIPEVVIGGRDGTVYAWRGDSSALWTAPGLAEMRGQPSIADLDGDGRNDVAVTTADGVHFIDGVTGQKLHEPVERGWAGWSAPAIGLLNGSLHVVASMAHHGERDGRWVMTEGRVSAHNVGLSTEPGPHAWPQWGKFASHTRSRFQPPGDPGLEARDVDDACPPGSVPEDGFSDVPQGAPHESNIDCIVWWGIASGREDGTYGPAEPVNRGQMAKFVANLLEAGGVTLSDNPPDAFADDDGNPFELFINQVAQAGVVGGYPDGEYKPQLFVTRAQMATFLIRSYDKAVGQPLPAGVDFFWDDDTSNHEPNIEKAAEAGIATGVTAGRYAPDRAVRRDQMASFVARTLDAFVAAGVAEPPSG